MMPTPAILAKTVLSSTYWMLMMVPTPTKLVLNGKFDPSVGGVDIILR